MRTTVLPTVFAALLSAAVASCSSTQTSESTGQYVDDAAITTKVKQAILADPALHVFQIGAETYKNTVQLSGFVDSPQARTHAGDVAASVPGVKTVHNNLIVRPAG